MTKPRLEHDQLKNMSVADIEEWFHKNRPDVRHGAVGMGADIPWSLAHVAPDMSAAVDFYFDVLDSPE